MCAVAYGETEALGSLATDLRVEPSRLPGAAGEALVGERGKLRRRMSTSVLTDRIRQYGLLMRLDRPIGTLLLLWPTLWALWIAGEGRPDPFITLVFVFGVLVLV